MDDYINVLKDNGIQVVDWTESMIQFLGHQGEGFRALAIALERHWPVSDLRRVWLIRDREPTGPYWELTFH